jgi:hypothetical protein
MLSSPLGDLEQDRLDPGVLFTDLSRSTEQIEVRRYDVVGVVLAKNDVNARDIEARGGRCQR